MCLLGFMGCVPREGRPCSLGVPVHPATCPFSKGQPGPPGQALPAFNVDRFTPL